ncbi:MAG: ABC transporter ATP-binding protein [Dorea sp.]|nr:ABC transporter ATP-binding protein [Dorea sp.]
MDVLTLSHVSRSFGGHQAVKDLSFSVPEHSVYGFIGPNGAGKTTTMKMILGLLKMDGGEITVHGQTVRYGQNNTNQYIGYLPDVPEFYGFLTPLEYLRLCGEVTGIPKRELTSRSEELLELVGLKNSNKRIQGFSRGMKQRLGIAQALLNRPKLLICDEPTSALDPAGRKEILEILQSVQKYAAVLFSTHILTDVERICDEIAFLHKGTLAFRGTMEDIRTLRNGRGFQAEFHRKEDAEKFSDAFLGKQENDSLLVTCEGKTQEDMLRAMAYLAENKISPRRIEMLETTLEHLFMEVIGR